MARIVQQIKWLYGQVKCLKKAIEDLENIEIDHPEYTLSAIIDDKFNLLKEGNPVLTQIDLTPYVNVPFEQEGYIEFGTRAGGDLLAIVGDYDNSANGTVVVIDDENEEIDLYAGDFISIYSGGQLNLEGEQVFIFGGGAQDTGIQVDANNVLINSLNQVRLNGTEGTTIKGGEVGAGFSGVFTATTNATKVGWIQTQLLTTVDRTYQLPNADGTLALLGDLSGFVPYTGANADLDMSSNSILADKMGVGALPTGKESFQVAGNSRYSGSLINDAGGGDTSSVWSDERISFNDTSVNTGTTYYMDGFSWGEQANTWQLNVGLIMPTAIRDINFPDASGTVALVENLINPGLQDVLDEDGYAESPDGESYVEISLEDDDSYFDWFAYDSVGDIYSQTAFHTYEMAFLVADDDLNNEAYFQLSENGNVEMYSKVAGFTTSLSFTTPTADSNLVFPTKSAGTYTLATLSDIVAPSGLETEGNGYGFIGADLTKKATIGTGSIDMSNIYDGPDFDYGPQGSNSLLLGNDMKSSGDNTFGIGWKSVLAGYDASGFGDFHVIDGHYSLANGYFNRIGGNVYYGFASGSSHIIGDLSAIGVGGTGSSAFGFGCEIILGEYCLATGDRVNLSSYASFGTGAFLTESSSSGYNFVGGQGSVNRGNANFMYGAALLQTNGVGCSVFGVANVDLSATDIGNTLTNPMFIIGNGTVNTPSGSAWTAISRSNLMVGLRNGEVTLPSTTTTVINAETTGRQILTREWHEENDFNLNTGVITGGEVSVNVDPTKLDIAAGVGIIKDWTDPLNPTTKKYTWDAQVGVSLPNIALAFTAVYMVPSVTPGIAEPLLISGLEVTPTESRIYIQLQSVVHLDGLTISGPANSSTPSYQQINAALDYIHHLGTINVNNNYVANGANLAIDKTTGESVLPFINRSNSLSNPTELTNPSIVATTLVREYQDGLGAWTIEIAGVVNPENWDDGTGVLASVGNNQYSIQRFYFFGQANATVVTYGQDTYSTLAAAEGGIFTENPMVDDILHDATFTTALIIKKGVTDIEAALLVDDAKFIDITTNLTSGGASGAVGSFVTEDTNQLVGLIGNKTWDGIHIFNQDITAPNVPQKVKVTLSAGQINNLNSAPVVLLPAPGAGKIITVNSLTARLNWGSVAFDELSTWIEYTGAGSLGLGDIITSGVADSIRKYSTNIDSNNVSENVGLSFTSDADSVAVGDSTIDLYITYEITTL